LDLRSESLEHLDTAEERVRSVLQRSLKGENSEARETSDDLDLDMILIGERPPGVTPSDSPSVEAALASTRMFDVEPDLVASSTDANFPMSLGIPAITLGAGGMAGDAHTLKEWYRNEGGTEGLQRALYTTLLTAGGGCLIGGPRVSPR
jgi:acetylornithine deacetylase/succinyl-diaminopimelate desuccinylase-like protein